MGISDPEGGSSEYYELPADAEEMQDLIEHKNMNFAMGNVFKACYRYGEKDGTTMEYDLYKIIWYANRELRRVEKLKWERENKAKPTMTNTTEPQRQRSSGPLATKPEQTR